MSLRFIVLWENYFGVWVCFLLSGYRWVRDIFTWPFINETPVCRVLFIKFIEQGALILHRQCFEEAVQCYGRENVFIALFEESVPTARLLGLFDEQNIISINHTTFGKLVSGGLRALRTCRRLKIDTTIDLEFLSVSSAIFAYLTPAKNRAGFHSSSGGFKYRGQLLTHRVAYSPYIHVSQSGRVLMRAVEAPVSKLPAVDALNGEEKFPPFDAAKIRAQPAELFVLLPEQIFDSHRVIIINPNFRDQLPLRQWQPDNYVKLVNSMAGAMPDCFFVFTGRPDEYDITNDYLKQIETPHTANLCGKTTLHTLLALYLKSRLLITTDSGPAHFASLTGLGGIVIFGPETPLLYGPLSGNLKVIYKNLPCSPCFNAYNNRVSACTDNQCVKSVTPSEVLALAGEMLGKS